MVGVLVFIFSFVVGGLAAAPANADRQYQQPAPAHLQRLNALQYYLDNPEPLPQYYQQYQERQSENVHRVAPSRLETLEPDSEVEILPGAQPQQPPQQNPVSPNLPGLVPGQRVFIVHMPVPGYRPGSIGGYQPVYVVAAAPNGNANNNNYAPNGYQNPLLLDPSGQLSPYGGYPQLVGPRGNPGYLIVAPAHLALARPYEAAYQDPRIAFQGIGAAPNLGAGPDSAQTVRLSQLIGLRPLQGNVVTNLRNQDKDNAETNLRSSRIMHAARDSEESKDVSDDVVNTRPVHEQNKQ